MSAFFLAILIGFGVSAATVIFLGVQLVVRQEQLLYYLNKNKYDRWSELTTFGPFGPGGRNARKVLRYMKSDLDNDSPEIFERKQRFRESKGRFWIAFLVMWGMCLLLAIVGLLYKRYMPNT